MHLQGLLAKSMVVITMYKPLPQKSVRIKLDHYNERRQEVILAPRLPYWVRQGGLMRLVPDSMPVGTVVVP